MKILNIYENVPLSKINENYSLVWCSRVKNKNNFFLSIYDIIDSNSKYLKKALNDYLKKFFFQNKNFFFPTFNLKKDFSFIVLSNFIEKNPYKKNFNLDLTKKIALELFLKSNKFNKIIIHTDSKIFREKINNILNKKNKTKSRLFLIRNYLKLNKFYIKNFIRIIIFGVKNINFKKKNNFKVNKKPIFFSFFSYTDKKKAMQGIYHSDYWKGFSKSSNKNWVHLYDPSFHYPNSKAVSSIIKNLNKKETNHFFIDDYMNIKVFLKTIFIFMKFYFFTSRLIMSKQFSKILKKDLYLTNENYSSFFEEFISFNSFRNILFFFQFEKFFLNHKIKSDIFFCFENQPWEKILLYFLKKNKHIKNSYGVIHSPIRFWDFRFINFISKKKKILGYFNPDKILVNSPFVKKILVGNGFNKSQLIEVETLRYTNLNKFKKKKNYKISKKLNILFLSDYDDHLNEYFIEFINELKFDTKYSLSLKCHPLRPLNMSHTNLKIINDIKDVKKNIDLVIVGNKTAAAVDFYYKKLNLLIFVEPDDMDYSPLYKFTNYSTFSSIGDLKKILDTFYLKFKHNTQPNTKNKKYFIVDKKLPRWSKITSL